MDLLRPELELMQCSLAERVSNFLRTSQVPFIKLLVLTEDLLR
jgi:hypothetical protein